jgi:hypothetical protein
MLRRLIITLLKGWRSMPSDLKDLLVWAVMEIVSSIKGKKKNPEKILIKLIKKSSLPNEQKMFMMTFIKYYYNDGKIDMDESLNLISLLFNLKGIPIKIEKKAGKCLIEIGK